MLRLQVMRCDPVPMKGGEEAVQTSFWGAVGSEPNGRRLPPSILTRALWAGSQARGPSGRPAFRHFPGRAGGASTPGLFCCSGTQDSKTSLNMRKFTVDVLLKPGLENFEHYFY